MLNIIHATINDMFVVVVVACTRGALIAIRASYITHLFYGIESFGANNTHSNNDKDVITSG